MKLYLVRHAIAEDHSAAPDAERALTAEGKAKMIGVTRGLRQLKVRLDLVLTSPLRRARETAEILATGLGGVELEELEELAPGGEPRSVIGALRSHAKLSEVALVGHQPSLGHLASALLAGADGCELDFKKGSVACLEMEFSARPQHGVLLWLAAPRLLRRL